MTWLMKRLSGRKSVLSVAALAGAAMLVSFAARAEDAKPAQPDSSLIAKGEYLARAGDCIACHTSPEGKLFAGGLPMPTPFGTLYTSNITPDRETGIGTWTADQFYAMLHTGRFPDGGLLYPAMPFGSYTKVTRPDSDAIFAYLKTIPPVRQANRPHDLEFPFNNRSLILGWRTLFFKEGEYEPDPNQSTEWNRGAYLVEGLGHCGMCHTAINALGGSSESEAFQGGLIPMQNWYAPSLTSDKDGGLGAGRGLWADGRGHLQQPAISDRRRYRGDGRLPQEPCARQAASARGLERPRRRRQSPGRARQDNLRRSMRSLSWSAGPRKAAELSAAGRQSVDRDGIGGQPDPHGAERRISARARRQPHALWNAAVRAVLVGRRGRRGCHLYPHRVG